MVVSYLNLTSNQVSTKLWVIKRPVSYCIIKGWVNKLLHLSLYKIKFPVTWSFKNRDVWLIFYKIRFSLKTMSLSPLTWISIIGIFRLSNLLYEFSFHLIYWFVHSIVFILQFFVSFFLIFAIIDHFWLFWNIECLYICCTCIFPNLLCHFHALYCYRGHTDLLVLFQWTSRLQDQCQ